MQSHPSLFFFRTEPFDPAKTSSSPLSSLRDSGSSIITGSAYHDLLFLHYIPYEWILVLLPLCKFPGGHERVIDLPAGGTLAGMDDGDEPILLHRSHDEEVDVAFFTGSPLCKRPIDEDARDLLTGNGVPDDAGNPFCLQHDLLEIRIQEMAGIDRVILLVSFLLTR